MKGNSFAMGASVANGNSMANGPHAQAALQGWDIRPVTHWDFTQGRDPF